MPGGVQKMCGYGTSGHALAGIVVLGWQLDLKILEVFSNLNDSMILWFNDSAFLISNILLKAEVFYMFLFSMPILSFHTQFLCEEGYVMVFV